MRQVGRTCIKMEKDKYAYRTVSPALTIHAMTCSKWYSPAHTYSFAKLQLRHAILSFLFDCAVERTTRKIEFHAIKETHNLIEEIIRQTSVSMNWEDKAMQRKRIECNVGISTRLADLFPGLRLDRNTEIIVLAVIRNKANIRLQSDQTACTTVFEEKWDATWKRPSH